jgi:hypothetical protein
MKSKLFGLLLLSCLFCLACEMRTVSSTSTSSVPIEYGSEAIITKKHNETGGLYSRHYELTIRGNGKVTLDGNFNNPTPVHAEWSIPRENFSRWLPRLKNRSFTRLKRNPGNS